MTGRTTDGNQNDILRQEPDVVEEPLLTTKTGTIITYYHNYELYMTRVLCE